MSQQEGVETRQLAKNNLFDGLHCDVCDIKATHDLEVAQNDEDYILYTNFFYCAKCKKDEKWYCPEEERSVKRRHKRLDHSFTKITVKEWSQTQVNQYKKRKNQVSKLTENELKIKKEVENTMKFSVVLRASAKFLPVSGLALQAGCTTYEIGKLYLKYHTNEITWLEFKDGTNRALLNGFTAFATLTVGMKVGSIGGSLAGGAIGAIIGFMFAGPLGATAGAKIGGTVGGFTGGCAGLYGGYKVGDKMLEKFYQDRSADQLKRKKELEFALVYFQFKRKEITDPKKFNSKILQKKYLSRAREAHPDNKLTGSHAKFLELQGYLGLLESLLIERDAQKQKPHIQSLLKQLKN